MGMSMKEFQDIDWTSLKRFRQSVINEETGRPFLQKELAVKAGFSQPYLARIERGDMTSPGLKYVEGIASALGMNVEQLRGYLKKRDQKTNFPGSVKIEYAHEPRKIKLFRDFYEPKGFKYSDGVLLDNPVEVPCPPQLDNDTQAYALELPANTMQPRYKAGDMLYVSGDPNLQPRAGDDVVLMFEHEDRQIAIVREVALVSGYSWGDYVEDGYAEEQNQQIRVMALNAKMRHMRSAKALTSFKSDPSAQIPPDGKLADYFIDDLATENKMELTDGPFALDGSDGVHVHLVVGSWKGRRHQYMQATSRAIRSEVGEATVTVTRANDD